MNNEQEIYDIISNHTTIWSIVFNKLSEHLINQVLEHITNCSNLTFKRSGAVCSNNVDVINCVVSNEYSDAIRIYSCGDTIDVHSSRFSCAYDWINWGCSMDVKNDLVTTFSIAFTIVAVLTFGSVGLYQFAQKKPDMWQKVTQPLTTCWNKVCNMFCTRHHNERTPLVDGARITQQQAA